ncbi:MAG: DUF362 domain-containing protein [Promethearchaeota archaeon]
MTSNQIAIQKIVNDDVESSVFQALELINAANLFKKPNLKILIKPNILLGKEPERAATTHPEVLKAVIKWLKQFNPKRIIVAESSGTFKRGATLEAFEKSGIKDVCEKFDVEWVPFEKTERKTYKVPNPLVLNEITASTLLDEVDIIINLPKIKTHGQCLLTCCIKNMFGTLILGNKARIHAQFPKKEIFNAALADIYSVSNPQLTIVDGYLCQEGNGPSAGDVIKLDIIIAGYDPVALDTTICRIIDFNPDDVYYIKKLQEKGFGSAEFEILGEPIENIKRTFKKPKSHPVSVPLPRFLAKYVGNVIFRSSIKFDKSKCQLCGTCWKNCPVQAIMPPKKRQKGIDIPKWDKNKCITCYCCAELCPYEAVDFKINILKNILTSYLSILGIGIILIFIYLIWLITSIF